jgi:hypothetical protein
MFQSFLTLAQNALLARSKGVLHTAPPRNELLALDRRIANFVIRTITGGWGGNAEAAAAACEAEDAALKRELYDRDENDAGEPIVSEHFFYTYVQLGCVAASITAIKEHFLYDEAINGWFRDWVAAMPRKQSSDAMDAARQKMETCKMLGAHGPQVLLMAVFFETCVGLMEFVERYME